MYVGDTTPLHYWGIQRQDTNIVTLRMCAAPTSALMIIHGLQMNISYRDQNKPTQEGCLLYDWHLMSCWALDRTCSVLSEATALDYVGEDEGKVSMLGNLTPR